ncbi:hypothetical protein BWI93_02720 [Siphonobacter sp. BAB-5385]|uniref:hypothetical protein n=1 Tax=Siphonobacter sp. BAB-5385 TaxID=1864822 RepID=UPI000B9E6D87|nr:hypothetical protein [Siphonobacter sp. BAB-5385]OZI09656.1 hypothetical protein BWI93_02720 [Siphonobacter sp. BAB-5385]
MEILLIIKRDFLDFLAQLELVKILSKCFRSLQVFTSDPLDDKDQDPVLYHMGHIICWLLLFFLAIGLLAMCWGLTYELSECFLGGLYMIGGPILLIAGFYLCYLVTK